MQGSCGSTGALGDIVLVGKKEVMKDDLRCFRIFEDNLRSFMAGEDPIFKTEIAS